MTNRRPPLKVFLCHASGDKHRVRALYDRLIADGVDAWLDSKKLLPGQDWRMEIPRAVREADVVIICLSNRSITKEGYIQSEIKFALDVAAEKPEGSIFLIPARLEKCVVPEQMNRWQWVDLFRDDGYQKLMRSLELRAKDINASVVKIKDRTRPNENKTSPTNHHEAKTIRPRTEPERPIVPFTTKLIFTAVLLVLLCYLAYTYFFLPSNQILFTCTPPTISAIGTIIALWFLVSLGWCYLEKPVKNLISTMPAGQQDFKIMLTKILLLLTDLFLLGQLSKKILLFLTTAVIVSVLTLWGLNWSGIPIFYVDEESPQVLGFSVNYSNGSQNLKPGDTIEVKRGQQFLVSANHQPVNVICSWFSAEKGVLVLETGCSTQYGPLLVTGEIDTLTVQIQSACQTKSIFTSLNIKILEP